jgi:hypothetical protein
MLRASSTSNSIRARREAARSRSGPKKRDDLEPVLSLLGLVERDRMVFEKAVSANIPVAVTLAGGYARHVLDTVQIHANTVRTAKEHERHRKAAKASTASS